MSDPTERIYCARQINIPPTFPRILKHYTKAAIRTQPYDLLRWTAVYFRALANGEVPPVKERLEYPPFAHPSGITPGYLKILLNRFGHMNKVRLRNLLEDWRGLDLPETSLYQIFMVADLLSPHKEHCNFYRFLAVACGFLGNNLLETMIYVCELLTHEPEGGSAMIPLRIFLDLYEYLAGLDCSGERRRRFEDDGEDEQPRCSCESIVSGELSSERTIDSCACSCEFAVEKSMMETDVANPGVRTIVDLTEHYDDIRENLDSKCLDIDVTDMRETIDDASEFNFEDEKEVIGEAEPIDHDTATMIDLESPVEKTCEYLGEPESDQTPPPPSPPSDSLKTFLEKMRTEVEAGRLETIFRVPGIGPPIASERVTAVGLWLADCARRQDGLVGPRNIQHFLCPNLDDISVCDCT